MKEAKTLLALEWNFTIGIISVIFTWSTLDIFEESLDIPMAE